ncbi:MAG: hypothetical protein IKZ25_03495 [Clostridia bacterium]|nr:hypothetical protein [Clostridia bacterium]
MYSCTFIGHYDCSEDIRESIYNAIENLILYEKVQTFYVGTNGRFDYFVYNELCKLEKIYNIKIFVVLSYLNNKNKPYYDEKKTLFPSVLETTPPRFAINKRNIYMIEKSQYMICYMNHTFSNTYTFVKKAKRKNLKIFNLGRYDIYDIN